jgi:hypothetical protein
LKDGVGIKMDYFDMEMVEKAAEEFASGNAESMLEK